MFKTPRLISLTLLTIGLLIGGLSKSAEAQGNRIGRQGSKATLGDSNRVDFSYSFSIFDTTSDGAEITALCDTEFSCLFENAVSGLTINRLVSLGDPINKISIGTEANTLDSEEKSSLDLEPFSSLNLRSKWEKDTNAILYGLTSSLDKYEPIKLEVFSDSQNTSGLLDSFQLGFELFRAEPPSSDNAQVLEEELVNNLVTDLSFILNTLRSPSSISSSVLFLDPPGFSALKITRLDKDFTHSGIKLISPLDPDRKGDFDDLTYRFENISDVADVPEPTSAAGLLIFTVLGIRFSKKKLL